MSYSQAVSNKAKTFQNFIGGKWVNSGSGKLYSSINPADTNDVLGNFQKSNAEDAKKAIDAAEKAFSKWSEMPAPKRGQILFRAAELLRERKQELGLLVTKEMGKPLSEGLGDVQEAIDVFEYMAGEGRRLFGYTTPSELEDKFAFTLRMPLGVVACITPWNFPIAVPSWKLSAALICGNSVVLKPAEDTTLCALRLTEILDKAGIPKGVVNLISGLGPEAGQPLIESKKIDAISFTGSKEIGELITRKAGVKKVGLELGGKNAIIVMDDAALSLAVDGIIWGGFGTTGQRCTAASRVIMHESIAGKLKKHLLERTKKMRIGPGWKKETDLGPLINRDALEKVHSYSEIAPKEGAKILTGGKPASVKGFKGFYYEPTLFDDVSINMRIAKEEIFGPSISLISASDIEEAIEFVNSVEYGLSSSIYTSSMRSAFKAIHGIETGITYINASTIGAEVHLPFGGMKSTGNGTREAGIEGIHEFSDTKTVYIDYSGRLQKAQIDSYKKEGK